MNNPLKTVLENIGFLKNLKFTGKYLCRSFNLVYAQAAGYNPPKRAPL